MTLALVFPGQGAQDAGMGVGLLDPGSPGHQLAREASDLVGMDVVGLACDADAAALRPTEVAQPVLLVHSVALLRALPDSVRRGTGVVAGHSLGEYTALVAAGSLDWREALKLVRERGLAMAEAAALGGKSRQGMAAVLGLEADAVAEALAGAAGDGVLVIANLNAPGQVVVSGESGLMALAAEALKAAGARRVMPLAVAGAFHSH